MMYSFLKIHSEKYPSQDPITSAQTKIQSETSVSIANCHSLYLNHTHKNAS